MNFSSAPPTFHELGSLPNISIALREALARVGLSTPEALRLAGAEAAWTRLMQQGEKPSIHTLLALEGAIENVPWQQIAPARRHALLRFTARIA